MNAPTTKHISDQTSFKAVVYFKFRADGTKFTQQELKFKKNRRYFDSYDFYKTDRKAIVVDHKFALRKLEFMVEHEFKGKYISAIIFANYESGEQTQVRKYVADKLVESSDVIFIAAQDGGTTVYEIKEKKQLIPTARTWEGPPKASRLSDKLSHLRSPGE